MKRVCEIRELGKHKRDSTQDGHLGVYGSHDWLKSQPFIVIFEILELRKGLLFELHRRAGG